MKRVLTIALCSVLSFSVSSSEVNDKKLFDLGDIGLKRGKTSKVCYDTSNNAFHPDIEFVYKNETLKSTIKCVKVSNKHSNRDYIWMITKIELIKEH